MKTAAKPKPSVKMPKPPPFGRPPGGVTISIPPMKKK